MNDFSNLAEKQCSSQEIYQGKILHVWKDTVELPNGRMATREVIRHVGAVAVIPLTEDKKVIIEHQFRYPLNRVVTEIPAGKLDGKSEDKLEAAKRELQEETGIVAKEWICLGDFVPTVAYCDEVITLYLARGLEMGTRNLDEDEFLNVRMVPLEELVEEIMKGNITDGKTQAGILKAYYYLKQEK